MRPTRSLVPMLIAGLGVLAVGTTRQASAQNRIFARAVSAFNDRSTNPTNSH